MSHSHIQNERASLDRIVFNRTGITSFRCYQCGKCSAGCPVAPEMDYTPTTLLRLMQLQTPDADKKILRSYSIWLCLTCHTCIARCPMEVDLPKVMDVLREESLRKNLVHLKGKQIVAFHKSFIDAIRLNGRLWEIGLIGEFKMRSLRLLQDIALVPSMLMKGKLSLMPPGKKSLVNRIFNNLHLLKERA